MIKFVGHQEAKLDDKGRLIFPAVLKSQMPEGSDMRFVVKKDLFVDCLQMWTMEEWTKESERIKSKLNFFNPNHARFWREYMRDRTLVTPDAKMGRINISGELLEAIGVTKDVVFLGTDHLIEIWAKDKFDASRITNEEYLSIVPADLSMI